MINYVKPIISLMMSHYVMEKRLKYVIIGRDFLCSWWDIDVSKQCERWIQWACTYVTQIGKYEEAEKLKFLITNAQKMISYMLMQRYAVSMEDFIWTLASFCVIKYKRIITGNFFTKKLSSSFTIILMTWLDHRLMIRVLTHLGIRMAVLLLHTMHSWICRN